MAWSTEDYQFFEFCLYETTHLITIGFICFIVKPLWTLTNGRPAMIIIFNKAIVSLIDNIGTMLQRTSNRIKWDALEATLFIWRSQNKLMHDMLEFALLLNIMALALNRMHCIMWPFHYNAWISKKKIVVQCILIWILGMLFATGLRQQTKLVVSTYQACTYIVYVAIGIYMIVGAKLAWKKFSSDELSQSASEKDFNKITIVCLGGMVPILIRFLAQTLALTINKSDPIFGTSMQIMQDIAMIFLYCGDELCLIVLLADFRRIIRKFLLSFFGGWMNYNSSLNNSQNVINIIVMPISKNGMSPISSVCRTL